MFMPTTRPTMKDTKRKMISRGIVRVIIIYVVYHLKKESGLRYPPVGDTGMMR